MKKQSSYHLNMKNNQQLLIFNGLGHISGRNSSKKAHVLAFVVLFGTHTGTD